MEKADSDSAKSPRGDDENRAGEEAEFESREFDGLPDPDTGLSDDERARIVRMLKEYTRIALIASYYRTRNSSANSTSNLSRG